MKAIKYSSKLTIGLLLLAGLAIFCAIGGRVYLDPAGLQVVGWLAIGAALIGSKARYS